MSLKKLLDEREMSVDDLTERSGISRRYLFYIVKGEKDWKNLSYKKIEALADAFEITVEELVKEIA